VEVPEKMCDVVVTEQTCGSIEHGLQTVHSMHGSADVHVVQASVVVLDGVLTQ